MARPKPLPRNLVAGGRKRQNGGKVNKGKSKS